LRERYTQRAQITDQSAYSFGLAKASALVLRSVRFHG
jgi:hypothetical protein